MSQDIIPSTEFQLDAVKIEATPVESSYDKPDSEQLVTIKPNLEEQEHTSPPLQSPPKTFGVIYLACGKKYVQEAIKSARSFKRFHPKIPITIHTDSAPLARSYPNLFNRVIRVSPKKPGMKIAPAAKLNKIKAMASSPYDVTLYLDCDTKILKPIGELFEMGKNYDLMIANSPMLDKTIVPYRLVSYVRPKAYNSGVIVYRKNEKIQNLFTSWLRKSKKDPKIWEKNKGSFFDQPKLVSLLNRPDPGINFKVIPNVLYNARHTMIPRLKSQRLYKNVKIIHTH